MYNIKQNESYTKFVSRLRRKWLDCAPDIWWGDNVDIRFLLTYKLTNLKNKRVLDVGCNAGVTLSEMDNSNYKVGIDIVDRHTQIAKDLNSDSPILKADMFKLPFKDSTFDTVILTNVLGVLRSLDDKEAVLREIHRVSKKTARFYLTTLNRRHPRYRNMPEMTTYEELESILTPYFDFEIKSFNPFPPFPYFLPTRVLAMAPGIWGLLMYLMDKKFLLKKCCCFYAECGKR